MSSICILSISTSKNPLIEEAIVTLDQPIKGPVYRMEERWREVHSDVIVFVHNDVKIHNMDYLYHLSELFDSHPRCAVAGFGGGTAIGTPDLYRKLYRIEQLIRHDYASNQVDAEIHGKRFEGMRKVAVLDGFLLAIRRSFLEEIDGFSWMQTRFHCYDLALCLEAWRRGWEVWMTGIACTHHGGGTSCSKEYIEWCTANNTTPALEHSEPHKWLYNRYRDILPFKVPE